MHPKKVAVIDMLFHQKTKSFHFFLDLLYQKYGTEHVDIFYDRTLEGGWQDFGYIEHKDNYDTFVFLQILPTPKTLYKLRGKNIVYVPMYDDFHAYRWFLAYLKTFHVKFISFSSYIHTFVHDTLWAESLYVQYYLPALSYPIDYSSKNIFWWYRGTVSWDDIKTILGNQVINKLTIKNIPDPFYKKLTISDEDIKKYHIELVETFFPTHEQHYRSLAAHNIFISPRRKEGIGMSFLDALSMGMCVVWYDGPTMDEYITDGVDGLLTDFSKEISLDNYAEIGRRAQQRYQHWYQKWQEYKKDIIDFIDKRPITSRYSLMGVIVYGSLHYVGEFAAMILWKIKLYIQACAK